MEHIERRTLVKGFVTSVCTKCGHVARNITQRITSNVVVLGVFHKRVSMLTKRDDEEPCKVCGQMRWRKCILDERR